MLWIQPRRMHRTFEVKTQPFLNAAHPAALGQIEEQHKVQDDRRSKNAVAAQEIDLDLHGITKPPVDIDVVPSFFIVSARRIVVNSHFVSEILIEIRIELGLKNLIQN